MTYKERKEMFTQIYNKYSKTINIHGGDCGKDNRAFSYIAHREIVLPESSFKNPSEWAILVLLHEIGHVLTNTTKMRTYEMEYLATQWSAIEAKKLGLRIRPEWKDAFQDYIWEKRQLYINHNGKGIPSKESLVIKW